jgi:hypothetical protein
MTFQPYNLVPGTQILHSLTDCYELTDEAEEVTHTVKLQADNDGVYLEATEKRHDSEHKGVTEYMSIGNKELSICIAKRILELYSAN